MKNKNIFKDSPAIIVVILFLVAAVIYSCIATPEELKGGCLKHYEDMSYQFDQANQKLEAEIYRQQGELEKIKKDIYVLQNPKPKSFFLLRWLKWK